MLKILKWKIKIFYTNKVLIALLFLIPILITAFIASSLIEDSIAEISINIIDEDRTPISKYYKNKIQEDERIQYFDLSYEEGIKEIEKNKISGMLIIKKGFSKKIKDGVNNELIELIYSKDNHYFKSLTDIFIQHYFGELAKYRNINYIFRNYESIDKENYIEQYTNEYKKIENENSYQFNFKITELGLRDNNSKVTSENFLLYRYTFGVVFLLAYILILIQSIESNIKKDGIIEKIILSKINFLDYLTGNLLGSVIPVAINLTIQLIALSIFTERVFNPVIIIYILLFSLSIGLLCNLLVKMFKKVENMYLMIPYFIIIIWIFGNILFNLEFLNIFNIQGSILPGAEIKEVIINLILNIDVNIKTKIVKEFTMIIIMTLMLLFLEYKEFKNAAS